MPNCKISQFAHTMIRAEIQERHESGERPKQTSEAIIDEMVRDRVNKRKCYEVAK